MTLPTWTYGTGSPARVTPADLLRSQDAREIGEEVTRRLRLMYYGYANDYSGFLGPTKLISPDHLNIEFPPPCMNMRHAIEAQLLCKDGSDNLGSHWDGGRELAVATFLWPEADSDENKLIVNGFTGVGPGQVSLFAKLNGGTDWTDGSLSRATLMRAVHINELRQAMEWLRRGRVKLMDRYYGGMLSTFPDEPWIGEAVAYNASYELRAIRSYPLKLDDGRGLHNVTILPTSTLTIHLDKLNPSDPVPTGVGIAAYTSPYGLDNEGVPGWTTWSYLNYWTGPRAWPVPGGIGSPGVELLGQGVGSQSQPIVLTGQAFASALQTLLDSTPASSLSPTGQIFTGVILKQTTTSNYATSVRAHLTVDFEINY